MNSIDSKASFGGYLKKYTVWFGVFFLLCIVPFLWMRGYNFFDTGDGLHQQYNYFLYSGRWYRLLAENIFVKHKFEIPMWDMSIGMGADSFITFLVGYLFDPGCMISVLTPIRYSEYAFDLVIAGKIYFAGLSYILFSYSRSRSAISSVAGAMVYVFSAIIYICFLQIGFANNFILFPLLMIGVDRLWNNKGHLIYVAVLAYCMHNSCYFTFMMGLMIIVYCVIRFFSESENRNARHLFGLLSRFIVFTVFGLGIGVGLELPGLIGTLNLNRLGRHFDIPFFSVDNLITIISKAFSYSYMGGDAMFGISAIVIVCMFAGFKRKSDVILKWVFGLFTVSMAFPIVGAVFHIMTYSTLRYLFGYELVLAYVVTVNFEYLGEIKKKQIYILLLCSLCYLPVAFVLGGRMGLFSGIALLSTVITVCLIRLLRSREIIKSSVWNMIPVAVSCVLVSGFCFTDDSVFVMAGRNTAYKTNFSTLESVAFDPEEMKDVRYSAIYYSSDDSPLNVSMVLGINGYDFYHTYCNEYVSQYYSDMAVNCSASGFEMDGFRGRTLLDIPNATRYAIREAGQDFCINAPYGYTLDSVTDNMEIYSSDNEASMVYCYDSVIDNNTYENMLPIDREEVLMKSCLLDETSTPVNEAAFEPAHTVCDYSMSASEGIEITGDDIMVSGSSCYLEFTFDDLTDSEISVYLDGISGDPNKDGFYLLGVVKCYDGKAINADYYTGFNSLDNYYSGKSNLLFDLGFSEGPVDSVRVYFFTLGEYSLNNVLIYSRSAEQLDSVIGSFYSHADLDNIDYSYDGNHINIDVDMDSDKYVFLSVPYSEGWHATVDGEAVKIIRANTGFMAIPITQGVHTIEFSYTTPYLVYGVAVSLGFLTVYVIYTIVEHKRRSEKAIRNGKTAQ